MVGNGFGFWRAVFVVIANFVLNKAGHVPQLVAEVTGGKHSGRLIRLVNARAAVSQKAHARGIRAVLVHNFHWVKYVPLALTHLLAMLVYHHTVQVDFFEWYLVG